jgi:hypothetical protein
MFDATEAGNLGWGAKVEYPAVGVERGFITKNAVAYLPDLS